MEGFIDKNGSLLIMRNGMERYAICPHSQKDCSIDCPLFGEVRMIPKTTKPKGKGTKAVTIKTYHLDLCKKTIVFSSLVDERKI